MKSFKSLSVSKWDEVINKIKDKKDSKDYYEDILFDDNRCMIRRKRELHVLSQGVFSKGKFIMPKSVSLAKPYLHSLCVQTEAPNDYFYCRQDPKVWKDYDAYAEDPEYTAVSLADEYKDLIPAVVSVNPSKAYFDEDGVFTVEPDCGIAFSYNGRKVVLNQYGQSFVDDEARTDIGLDLLSDKEALDEFIKSLS